MRGNEYNKFDGNLCSIGHTITLPFTRALLGPMDFTPGGFLNHAPTTFKSGGVPAEVPGSRACLLAMTVVYPSPLLVLCDSPKNYRGQPGIDFLREMPTVWDESVVLSGEGGSIDSGGATGGRALVSGGHERRRGGGAQRAARLPRRPWTLHAFADDAKGFNYRGVVESTRQVDASSVLLRALPSFPPAASSPSRPAPRRVPESARGGREVVVNEEDGSVRGRPDEHRPRGRMDGHRVGVGGRRHPADGLQLTRG